jgi:hypothetical protein
MKRICSTFIILGLVASPVVAVAQAVINPGGGSGSSSITIGSTPITGGATTQVLYNLAGVVTSSASLTHDGTNTSTTGIVFGKSVTNTCAAPSFSFTGQTGTGMSYDSTNNALTFGHAGTCAAQVQSVSSMFTVNNAMGMSTSHAAAADGGWRRLAAGVIGMTLGGADNGWIQNSAGELAINADYTNATTTFSNTALSTTVISGRTYNFSANLLSSDSVAADGMKIDFAGGSAAATNFRVNCMASNDTTGATVAFTAATSAALATVINIPTMASTGTHMIECNGTFVPSGAGTFIIRAGKNTNTTGTLTITRGSWLSLRDARPL